MQGRAVHDERTPVHGWGGGAVGRRPFVMASGECAAMTGSARACAAAGYRKRGRAPLRGVREGEGTAAAEGSPGGRGGYHMGAPGGAGDIEGWGPLQGRGDFPVFRGAEHETCQCDELSGGMRAESSSHWRGSCRGPRGNVTEVARKGCRSVSRASGIPAGMA